ncbi:hypothetical protein XENOCAPTIV_019618 [Xenoophorus captivus]|uniref:Intraflagellar transport protein 46 homolog n=1 Tax=Xenoophorus captivus TaxID=1517983 RepID=A0ABV0R9R2_9TELE
MEPTDRGKDTQLLKNQPYDESLEVEDGEEVSSVYSPTPRGQAQVPGQSLLSCPLEEPGSWALKRSSVYLDAPQTHINSLTFIPSSCQSQWSSSRKVRSIMSATSSRNQFDEEHRPLRAKEPVGPKPGASPNQEEEEEDEEEDDSEEDDTDDDDDDDEPTEALEGAYDPADYANLPVPRPDGKPDNLGLLALDEPSVKQSDPTVLSLWLSEETKQHGATELKKVTSVASPQTNPRAVDSWVDSISALHRSKPPASVQYSRPMPDIDSLMQEWPSEVEELLGRLQLPPARLGCGLQQYVDLICGLLDIPVYNSRVQSLHLLFSLYLEFRDSQHFTRRL